MSARGLIALFLCFATAQNLHAAGDPAFIPPPIDLKRDAAQAVREGKPVVILFTLPGCRFCHVVRQNYLVPLLRDSTLVGRPIIREVEISSAQSFSGFQGETTSHSRFAQAFNIRFAPTVLFLGPSGHLLAEPIVGGDTAGLYGGYLDNAYIEATKKMSALRQANIKGGKP